MVLPRSIARLHGAIAALSAAAFVAWATTSSDVFTVAVAVLATGSLYGILAGNARRHTRRVAIAVIALGMLVGTSNVMPPDVGWHHLVAALAYTAAAAGALALSDAPDAQHSPPSSGRSTTESAVEVARRWLEADLGPAESGRDSCCARARRPTSVSPS